MHYRTVIIVGLAWLGLDLVSKKWAENNLQEPWVIIDRFFNLTFHQNTGIAFGIKLPPWFQIIISIALMGFLVGLMVNMEKHNKTFLNQCLFGIILGGAMGNLVGRLTTGGVTDFIAISAYPVFNVADIGITVGLAGLLLISFKSEKNKK